MKTLSNIKKDLDFNRGLSSLIEVLKTISVAQLRALEQEFKSFERLHSAIATFLDGIEIEGINHPFVTPKNKSQAIVLVTSDSGLLGGLNMQVISRGLAELEKAPGRIIVVGEKGKNYLKETNTPFVAFPGIKDQERLGQAMQLRDYLLSRAMEGLFGFLKVVYPHPVSFTVQRIEVVSFLPYLPTRTIKRIPGETSRPGVILESKPKDIIEYLVYTWVGQRLHEIFGLSRLAEFAARFMHLEGSHQRLKEMDSKILLEYFHVRHELIDRNMRELFAARLAFQ